ncbi:MAG: hypothetical protein ABSG65_30515 [Bryobacteraceae bacterium]
MAITCPVEFPPDRGQTVVELVQVLIGWQTMEPFESVKEAFSEPESSPIPLVDSIWVISPTVIAHANAAQSAPRTAAVRVVTLTASFRV